jgi:hypothetical protein
MATSTEYLTQVSNLYVALFNRAPDTEGMKFWSEGLANGASLSAVTNGFLNAPEGLAIYAPGQTGAQFVSAFYQTVFGRAPDAGGLAFWLAALDNAGGVGSGAARTFLVSALVDIVSEPLVTKPSGLSDAEYATTLNDRALFGNKVAYGTFVGTHSGTVTPGTQTSLSGITADPSSVTAAETAFNNPGTGGGGGGGGGGTDPDPVDPAVPTTGDDLLTVTATDFAATGYTLDGLDGNDTLTVTAASGALDGTGKLTSIESLLVAAADATTVDATLFSGVTSFGSSGSAAPVSFTNLTEGQTAEVSGVNVDTSFGYDDTATAAAVSLKDVQGGAVHVSGTTLASLALSATGEANEVALVSVIGAAAATEEATATPSAITALTIDASATGATSIGAIEGLSGAALTVTGTGQLAITALTGVLTVDASASTGGVAIYDLASASSYLGSGAADLLGVSGTWNADATIDMGGGDDQLSFVVGTVFDPSGLTVTLGEGADTVDVSALVLGEASDESLAATLVTIGDFGAGDTITFSTVESAATGAIQFTDLSASEALYVAASTAVETAAAAATPATIAAFQWGGDTYLVADTATDGAYNVGDILVKLSGVVDMSTVTLVGNSVNFALPVEPELV